MIIQISRTRLVLYGVTLTILLSLWVTIGCLVMERVENTPEGLVVVTLKFLAPMKPSAVQNLVIEQLDHHQKVPFEYTWQTANTLQIRIPEKNYPRGNIYRYRFKGAPSMFWPFYVWAGGKFQANVPVRFIGIEGQDTVPSKGPVILQFNTDVKATEINKYIKMPVPGRFEPVKIQSTGKNMYTDLSRWKFWPDKKLKNLNIYEIGFLKGLPGQHGGELSKTVKARFKTTAEFLIQQVYPRPGSASVWLSRDIVLETNQPLKAGSFNIKDLPGKSVIKGNKIQYLPDRLLLPGKTYQVKTHLVSVSNETLDYQYSFSTTNLGHNRWLEFKRSPSPTLWLMEGNKTLKEIQVTVKTGREIPTGTLYEQNRSINWIRLNADILLHDLPVGRVDHHDSMGLPPTYSCIYLSEKDLKDLLQTLPPSFMFTSH